MSPEKSRSKDASASSRRVSKATRAEEATEPKPKKATTAAAKKATPAATPARARKVAAGEAKSAPAAAKAPRTAPSKDASSGAAAPKAAAARSTSDHGTRTARTRSATSRVRAKSAEAETATDAAAGEAPSRSKQVGPGSARADVASTGRPRQRPTDGRPAGSDPGRVPPAPPRAEEAPFGESDVLDAPPARMARRERIVHRFEFGPEADDSARTDRRGAAQPPPPAGVHPRDRLARSEPPRPHPDGRRDSDRSAPRDRLDRGLPDRQGGRLEPPGRSRDERTDRADRRSEIDRRVERIQRERMQAQVRRGGNRPGPPPPARGLDDRRGRPMNRSGHLGRIRSGEGTHGGRDRRDGRKRDLLEGLRMLHRGVSIDPFERLVLETVPDNYSTRVIDLIAPIGRGQRCLITSPPKAGKTMLLMAMAEAILKNHPDVTVVVLLVDERPEEVTYFRRGVPCEVVASSNDMTPADHVRTAEETVVRVADLVMEGKDVVLFLDSITRLARAYNIFAEGSGRTMSGGIDASTMYGPRRIFGAARKIENGGSLTIAGTALVDTGSRMDEVIFQEFKGTGNTEIVLSRDLANKRIFPAVDVLASGSRKEEKLYPFDVVSRIHRLRRFMAERKADEAMLGLIKMMEAYRTNRDLLKAVGG